MKKFTGLSTQKTRNLIWCISNQTFLFNRFVKVMKVESTVDELQWIGGVFKLHSVWQFAFVFWRACIIHQRNCYLWLFMQNIYNPWCAVTCKPQAVARESINVLQATTTTATMTSLSSTFRRRNAMTLACAKGKVHVHCVNSVCVCVS